MAPDGHHQGRGRRRRRTVQRDPGALPGAGGDLVCRRTTPRTTAARDTARASGAGLGGGGVGQPPDRRGPAAVRRVLGPHRRDADCGRRPGRQFVEGAVNSSRDSRTRSVGAAVGLDADGGGPHGVRRRDVRAEHPRSVPLLPARLNRGRRPSRPGKTPRRRCCWLFTVVAILWANSPWAQSYSELLDTHVGVASAIITST